MLIIDPIRDPNQVAILDINLIEHFNHICKS